MARIPANPLRGIVPVGYLEFTDFKGALRLKPISHFEFYCRPDCPGKPTCSQCEEPVKRRSGEERRETDWKAEMPINEVCERIYEELRKEIAGHPDEERDGG